ncbi:hypothetical protein KIN20_016920 [Parelaphostrongylus tenuis]|uniref:Mitochondrial fission process protein 1 n=1 Tax=Parelaphostrongylus tenuis TaxID=148309 RepID=A0AAD5MH74_PARTN|nr:hypothetical protein KIN20_016920 [Parelaphostrongylus tenuis]
MIAVSFDVTDNETTSCTSMEVPGDDCKAVRSELPQIDNYRETPVRYLGYANEIGEAFRSILPLVAVRATYVVSFGYACADALDKSSRVYRIYKNDREKRRHKVSVAAMDTLIWQSLASVAIPGFTINRVCHFSGLLINRVSRWPAPVRKWIVTAIGLCTIPFIVHPIDMAVEIGMNETLRRLYSYEQFR